MFSHALSWPAYVHALASIVQSQAPTYISQALVPVFRFRCAAILLEQKAGSLEYPNHCIACSRTFVLYSIFHAESVHVCISKIQP